MPSVTRSYRLGFFPEQGTIDKYDKKISLPLMKLELGKFEYVFVVLATWCSIPIIAWTLLPCLLNSVIFGDENRLLLWLVAVCFPILVAVSVLFYYFLVAKKFMSLYSIHNGILIIAAVVPAFIVKRMLGPRARHVHNLMIFSWIFANALCRLIGTVSRRMRPIVSLTGELSVVAREFETIRLNFVTGQSAFSSFPCIDTASATILCYLLCAHGVGSVALLIPLASGIANVYFHAHHVLDVLVGAYLGYYSVTKVISWWGIEGEMNNIHTIVAGFVHYGLELLFAKYLVFDIPAEFRMVQSPSPKPRERKSL